MASPPSIHLRPATNADEPFLEQLYFEAHIGEFLPLGLPEPELHALLRMQFRAQRAGYATDFADAVDHLVLADGSLEPLGRLLVATRRDAIHLVDIALVAAARGLGIGTQLLGDLFEESRQKNLPVRLQVRPGNPALKLYSRLGFRLIGGGMNLEMEFLPNAAPEDATLADQAQHAVPESHPIQQWACHVGSSFRIADPAYEAFPPLLLAHLERVRYAASAAYSLIFHGPADRLLPQSMYSLRLCSDHSQPEADVEDRVLFLVPIGPKEGVMQYEAVFA